MMSTEELELRERLIATANQAMPHRFTLDTITRKIRRRRARIIGGAAGSLLIAGGLLSAVFVSFAGANRPQPPGHMPPAAIWPTFTLNIRDQSRLVDRGGMHPLFNVVPGKNPITIVVTDPPRHVVTALWLGISRGTFGDTPAGPTGLQPILLSVHKPISSGPHRFQVDWDVPPGMRFHARVYLVAAWIIGDSQVSSIIAILNVD